MRCERVILGGRGGGERQVCELPAGHESHAGPAGHVGKQFLQRRDARRPGGPHVAAQVQRKRYEAVFTVQRVEFLPPDLHDPCVRMARRERERIVQRLHRRQFGQPGRAGRCDYIGMVVVLERRVVRKTEFRQQREAAGPEFSSWRPEPAGRASGDPRQHVAPFAQGIEFLVFEFGQRGEVRATRGDLVTGVAQGVDCFGMARGVARGDERGGRDRAALEHLQQARQACAHAIAAIRETPIQAILGGRFKVKRLGIEVDGDEHHAAGVTRPGIGLHGTRTSSRCCG